MKRRVPQDQKSVTQAKEQLMQSLRTFDWFRGVGVERAEDGSLRLRVQVASAAGDVEVPDRVGDVPVVVLRIDGYTDSTGDAAYNQGLSQRRADAVRRGLLATSDALTIVARGHGEADPVADNATDSGRQQNRRVTITVADQ